jgi:predicted SAM-dependent methyltransferase
MEFTNTRLSVTRPIRSYSKVQNLISRLKRNRHAQVSTAIRKKKEYLDIGCGPQMHEHCLNLDYSWREGLDLCWDVTRGLPLPTASMRGIFSEHCLEHLPFGAVPAVLAECWRVLKPGGVFRLIVPDGELYLRGYAAIADGASLRLPYADGDAWQGMYTPMMSINRIFRDHGHLFIYDFETLERLLAKAGFSGIAKCKFNEGRDSKLLIDTASRAEESLRIEAIKRLAGE